MVAGSASGVFAKTRSFRENSEFCFLFLVSPVRPVVCVVVPAFSIPDSFPSNEAILSILWLGIVSTGLSFIGYVRLIEKVGAVKTSTVAYFLPVFGIIWGNIFLDELVSFLIIVGCIMVLVGVFFATSNRNSIGVVDGK